VPEVPSTAAFGQTRSVGFTSTISFGGVRNSVPHRLVGERVWVRRHGEEVVIVHARPAAGPVEVAPHPLSIPGQPRIAEEHYPPRPAGPLGRVPRARTAEEAAFLALGEGASAWLVEAAAAGAPRIRREMAEAPWPSSTAPRPWTRPSGSAPPTGGSGNRTWPGSLTT
jgi:hypothetical protein